LFSKIYYLYHQMRHSMRVVFVFSIYKEKENIYIFICNVWIYLCLILLYLLHCCITQCLIQVVWGDIWRNDMSMDMIRGKRKEYYYLKRKKQQDLFVFFSSRSKKKKRKKKFVST
jgi:hypothetical protein